MTCILLVERNGAYTEALQRRYDVTTASSGKQAIELIDTTPCTAVVLDALSLKTPGDRIAKQIKSHRESLLLIHLRPEANGSDDHFADVTLTPPFTVRKIINQLERFLNHHEDHPAEAFTQYGDFAVDLERRLLVAHGREMTLTPKLAQLLEHFLQHPGQTLNRRQLMEAVWDTNFMGDTRTLDVHIRLIRQAIELDPSKPCILKTVRGVGYRLEATPAPIEVAAAAFSMPIS